MEILLFLLLPVAAFSGWLTGRKSTTNKISLKYFTGLNYSLSQQPDKTPDKTLDALVQMPSIDDYTIETHLTLGSIFRRRGEIERAIRLHQGLLERSTLANPYKSQALLELARDYIAAGVLDRAEAILLELIANNEQLSASLQHLLELYQQGKEWQAAINIAYKLQEAKQVDLRATIAHYYCELAEQALKTQHLQQAKYWLKHALKSKQNCSRAIILRANIEQALGNYNKAVKLYKHLAAQNVLWQGTKFRCMNCGFLASKLQWHCPSCKQWEMIKPLQQDTA